MPLLNFSFLKLLIILACSVLPGILGIYLIVISEEAKRDLRNKLCNKLFGVSNAIEYPKFARFLYIVGTLLVLFSAFAIWFNYLRKMLAAE